MRRLVIALLALAAHGAIARAQPQPAESAIRPGVIGPAEAALYDAVRVRPRDPEARAALGRYLVARGATRVGMTLLEEALQFGGDTARIEPDLARAYRESGEYRALAGLTLIPPGERQRAQWLVEHETRTIASDSMLMVPFDPAADSTAMGVITVRVNGVALDARVSSSVLGIVIADTASVARSLRRFPGDADRGAVLAAADSIGIGGVTMSYVPLTIGRVPGAARMVIGLDVLGRFAPTFDPETHRMTLRVGVPRVAIPAGTRFVTWRSTSGLQILESNGWISVTRPSIMRLLQAHRWTFDASRGELIVEPL